MENTVEVVVERFLLDARWTHEVAGATKVLDVIGHAKLGHDSVEWVMAGLTLMTGAPVGIAGTVVALGQYAVTALAGV